MQIDRIGIRPRIRSAWEAIDLGFLMARQNWKVLYLSWMIPAVAVFLIASLIFFQSPWVVLIIVWWLKPVWDWGPLYINSRALFGDRPSYGAAIRKIPGLLRFDGLAWLTWRRLSPGRSFVMPVTVLEGLKGQPRSRRIGVLQQKVSNAASWLTIVCVHIEGIVTFGIIALIAMMVPDEYEIPWFAIFGDDSLVRDHLLNLLSFLAMSLVAPFYTSAGFALYISRRIELEAWDIEIRFRHLADRFNSSGALAGVLLAATLGFLVLGSEPGWAQESSADAIDHAQNLVLEEDSERTNSRKETAKQNIEEILARSEFHVMKESSGWRLKAREPDTPEAEKLPEWFIQLARVFDWLILHLGPLKGLFSTGAGILEFLLWVVVISLAVYLAYRYRYLLKYLRASAAREQEFEPAQSLFGLDLRAESLPDDVPGEVLQLWNNGEGRAAIGLLYRATLYRLLHQFGFYFNDSHTESECCQIVRLRGEKQLTHYMLDLTRVWQHLAYAHRLPTQETVVQLTTRWREVFSHE